MKARLPQEYTSRGANDMMKQAQKVQADMLALEEELSAKEYTASAGGSMVEATVNGDKEIVALSIKPEVVDPEDIEMLTDLIIAAVSGAQSAASLDASTRMQEITGGMTIPGL